MESRHEFSAICKTISLAGMIATLYILIKLLHGQSDFIFPVFLMICSLVVCPLNIIFARKERTIGVIVAFNAVIFTVFVAVVIISGCLNEGFSYPYAIIAFILIVIFGASSVLKIPTLSSSIICFDGAVAMLIIICIYVDVNHFAFSHTVFSIIGAFIGLLGLIAYRTSGSYGKREWGIMIIIFLIIALIAWVLYTFVVSPLSVGFELAGGTIASIFSSLGTIIDRFMKFLASLIKTDDISATADLEASPSMPYSEVAEEGTTDGLQLIIIASILAAVIAIAIILLIIYRKNKTKSGSRKKIRITKNQNNISFKDAIIRLIIMIMRYYSSQKFLRSNRNRAEGIYFDLVRMTKHTSYAKKEGDTASEFLLRLKELLIKNGYDTLCFDSLIQTVNNNFYGRIPDNTEFPSARALKRSIRMLKAEKSKEL